MRRGLLFKTMGNELRYFRKLRGLDVKDVAKILDVSVRCVERMERNTEIPTDEQIEKLSVLYGVNKKNMYKGFKVIPYSMIDEICSRHEIFDIFYNISESEDISDIQKGMFYEQVISCYNNSSIVNNDKSKMI